MLHSSRPDLQRFLDRLTRRSILSEEEQQSILNLPAHAEQVHAGRDFVKLGEMVEHSCLVVGGYVGRFDQKADGMRQITALHIPGDIANLHSVVQPEATSALQALSTATILRIPHSALRGVAAAYPAVAEAFWRDCAVDGSILAQWVVNVGRRKARTRIAHVLCEIATRLEVTSAGGEKMFPFPVTQMQLADITGMTAVHVNRTLQALRAEGLIELKNNARIFDWKALAEAGEFNADYLQMDIKPKKRIALVEAS